MDIEDEGWVSVLYDGLPEVHDDGDEIFSRKYVKCPQSFYEPSHFSTSQNFENYVEDDPVFENEFDHKEEQEVIKHPILIMDPEDTSFELETERESSKDPIFQVFFKKENQFVEMTMGSSRPSSQESESCTETGAFQCEEKKVDQVFNCSSSSKMIKEEVVAWKESNQRLNFWKLSLNGIGVFCSLGMAAAAVCIIICGNGRRHKQQNQKLKFQIHPDNERIKQVVQKANEAMSAVRGVPLVNAKITYGGNYDSI